ncbi:M16 family metallopeptidase [Sphingomonas mollis]|uniref:Insulinase family protein n=1 Tax=Sphingomonas mollis TaxID=2795726 RepID=A0ABS0XV76_9SPHN|nr:pitrilysin family protein [Sphingomonas sp. BT553]MBJ6123675.1 insulinase family protein [Sphingomonas sp. BT553]
MRPRHVLLTCAAVPLLALYTPAAKALDGGQVGVSSADIAAVTTDVRRLIDQVDIPYDSFTLPNGLRVLVHQDRSTPVVHVSVSYDVGSKHEPAGRSGFAHLFEHLMFTGSENVPGDYVKLLMNVGASVNGSTNVDRTNYYETVPTPALDRALFMESDRMGHLLGALDQRRLDAERGVVQNEKRDGSAAPASVIEDRTRAALYPANHPYGHSIIGSMRDLDAATLTDVRRWFNDHYGPNNALVVLAGDIDLPTAQRLMTRYFGSIPAGLRNTRPDAGPVPLARTISETATAPVTSPIIVRDWPVPGAQDPDGVVLDVAMDALGGGESSVLTRRLVHEQKLFQYVGVRNSSSAQAGEFSITGAVRQGVDPKVAATALDREIADFLRSKPDAETIARFIARYTYDFARSFESVGERASALAGSAMTTGDPDAYKVNLRVYAAQTPDSVMAVARKWLERPRYELTVMPGPRVTPKDDEETERSVSVGPPAIEAAVPLPSTQRRDRTLPAVGAPSDARFPAIERARLRNGVPVIYARGPSIPFTTVSLDLLGGGVDEPLDQAGTMNVMYASLGLGFAGHDEEWINKRKELMGLSLSASAGSESGTVDVTAPDVSLDDGLGMMREMVSAPTFPVAIVERLKREAIDGLAGIRLDPDTLINEVMSPLVDAASPYNRLVMYDSPSRIRSIDQAGVMASFKRWIRPEHASIVVVSDKPLAALLPSLERTIGSWQAGGKAVSVPPLDYKPRPGTAQIVLIDLPGAVQAVIQGRQTVPVNDGDPATALLLASRVLGNGFTSRINMNLREDKHWSYGAQAGFSRRRYGSQYRFNAKIQQDKAGSAIAEVLQELKAVVDHRPITQGELDTAKAVAIGEAASRFASREAIAGELDNVRRHGRPDTYPQQTSARYRAVTLDAANAALRAQLSPDRWVWAIVGNAAIIRPQLDALGLPLKVVKAADVLPPL